MAVSSLLSMLASQRLRPMQSSCLGHHPFHLTTAGNEAVVISGRKFAQQIKQEVQQEVEEWVASSNKWPHMSVLLVGESPASHSYVLNKTRAAADVGINSKTIVKPASISEEKLLNLINKLNNDDNVDGLLVQLFEEQEVPKSKELGVATNSFFSVMNRPVQEAKQANRMQYLFIYSTEMVSNDALYLLKAK